MSMSLMDLWEMIAKPEDTCYVSLDFSAAVSSLRIRANE